MLHGKGFIADGQGGCDLDAVREALSKRTELERLRGLALDEEEKPYVYALASWLTRADGVIKEEETKALGDVLGLGVVRPLGAGGTR